MTTEQNKAIVRRFFEAFAANDQEVLEELLAPDVVVYSHNPRPLSREEYLLEIRSWNAAFSETHFTVQEQIAEGDKVATRAMLRSTHGSGAFQGLPPTGKQIEVGGITFERIRDGKIVEHRVESNWYGMLQQLGLIP